MPFSEQLIYRGTCVLHDHISVSPDDMPGQRCANSFGGCGGSSGAGQQPEALIRTLPRGISEMVSGRLNSLSKIRKRSMRQYPFHAVYSWRDRPDRLCTVVTLGDCFSVVMFLRPRGNLPNAAIEAVHRRQHLDTPPTVLCTYPQGRRDKTLLPFHL